MNRKLKCNSCGHAELMSSQDVYYCPECGSSDVVFETDPLAESRAVADAEAELEIGLEAESKVVPEAPPRPVSKMSPRQKPQSLQRCSGYGFGMSDSAKIRIVLGIIGLILVFSAVGILFSGRGPDGDNNTVGDWIYFIGNCDEG